MDSCLVINVFCVQMNQNLINNTAYNYLSSYKLSMEHFKEMKKLVAERIKTKFYLYKKICKQAPNSQVTEGKCLFVVEIDAGENRGLVEDLKKNFLMKVVGSARTKNNKGCHTEVGNLFLKVKVFK